MKNFNINNAFNRLSSGNSISLQGLGLFSRHNGVYLSMEDCDAILRRFDHNGNTRIEFDEFYELVTGFEVEKSNEIPEKETKFTELKPVDDRKSS